MATGTAVAQWAQKAKKMLLEGGLGGLWEEWVDQWWALERSTDFVTQPKTHPTTSRPTEVGLWVKSARKGTPKVEPQRFAKDWWAWWTAINPEWCVDGGKLLRIEREGSWEELRRPGQNGFLNIVVCLRCWRIADGKETDDWVKAVEDVKWVLRKVVG
ncbi:hypothetical protein B0H16DRAFT_1482125 [Mycena metata]|uniref:Uncharacterized protein n=1 Tax=Mycena metata TaxID=1033252 RepID=A0AAD7M8L1_9AGAR|nr:hypothetical protein B0H16DRAFT_1482125 [Mycena metata]